MNFGKTVSAALLAAMCAGWCAYSVAEAAVSAEIRLDAGSSPYTLKKIDCAASGVHTLHVSGLVQLVYPGEQTPGNLPTIEINCEHVIFDQGAKLTSLSSIVLDASSVQGSIVVQTLSRSDGRSGNVSTRIHSGSQTVTTRTHRPRGNQDVDTDLKEEVDSDSTGARGAGAQGPSIDVESYSRGANGAKGEAVHGSNGAAGGSSSTTIDIPGLSGPDTPASDH